MRYTPDPNTRSDTLPDSAGAGWTRTTSPVSQAALTPSHPSDVRRRYSKPYGPLRLTKNKDAKHGPVPMDAAQIRACLDELHDVLVGELAAFMGLLTVFEDVALAAAFQRLVDMAHECLVDGYSMSAMAHSFLALRDEPWTQPTLMVQLCSAVGQLDHALAQFSSAQNITGAWSLNDAMTPSQQRRELIAITSELLASAIHSVRAVHSVLELMPPSFTLEIWRPSTVSEPPSARVAVRVQRALSPPVPEVRSHSAPLMARHGSVSDTDSRRSSVDDSLHTLSELASQRSTPPSSVDGMWGETSVMTPLTKRRTSVSSLGTVVWSEDGQLLGGDLAGLVHELCKDLKATPTSPLAAMFLLSFRWCATPAELLAAVGHEFDDATIPAQRAAAVQLMTLWLRDAWYAPFDYDVLAPLHKALRRWRSQPGLANACSVLSRLAITRQQQGCAEMAAMVDDTLTRLLQASTIDGDTRSRSVLAAPSNASDKLLSALEPEPCAPAQPLPLPLLAMLQDAVTIWDVDVLEMDPVMLAEQITLHESEQFRALGVHELLNRPDKYKHSDYVSQAVHVKAMSLLTTQLTNWIGECILRELALPRRIELLRFFIQLGTASLALQNYNLLMAVLAAFNSSTIRRLKRTWAGLAPRWRHDVQHLERVMEPTRNFATYRARLRTSQGPTLPFLGLLLTDLSFAKNGNPVERQFAHVDEPLINMVRIRTVHRICEQLRLCEQPYDLPSVPLLQTLILHIRAEGGVKTPADYAKAAEVLYQRSLQVEPRTEPAAPPPRTRSASVVSRTLQAWRLGASKMSDAAPPTPTLSPRSSEPPGLRDLFVRRSHDAS